MVLSFGPEVLDVSLPLIGSVCVFHVGGDIDEVRANAGDAII